MGKRKHRSYSSDDEKRKRSCSSSITTSSSADAMEHHATDRRKSTESEEKKKRKKKKAKKEHKKSKKHKSHKSKRSHHSSPECFGPLPSTSSPAGTSESKKSERVDEVATRDERVMKMPITKEQWEKERNTIRHVFDPETGRNRLVRGSGEILEEIVSKKRHAEINKQATFGDGLFYQFKAGLSSKSTTK